MTLFYFPQWQGSFADNRLYPSAQMLREFIASEFDSPTFVDILLDSSARLDREEGIIARQAILCQARNARAVLMENQPERVFVLGGDCGIEVMPVTYLNARYGGNLALIWFDAHADLNTPQTSPSGTFHGMPLRVILGEGDPSIVEEVDQPLTPQQVFLVGVREFDLPERVYVDQNEIMVMPEPKVTSLRQWLEQTLIPTVHSRGYAHIYIHFDLDALDPSEFTSIDYPTPDGLSLAGAVDAIQLLADSFKLVGMSITEYASETGQGLELLTPLLGFFVAQSRD